MDKAIFTGCSKDQIQWGGHDDPSGILVEGQEYIIEDLIILSSSSKMKLVGVSALFNSVCFDFDEDIWDRYAEEQGW